MIKVILETSNEGWLLRDERTKTLLTGTTFRTDIAAKKFLQVNWPGAEVAKVDVGWCVWTRF